MLVPSLLQHTGADTHAYIPHPPSSIRRYISSPQLYAPISGFEGTQANLLYNALM